MVRARLLHMQLCTAPSPIRLHPTFQLVKTQPGNNHSPTAASCSEYHRRNLHRRRILSFPQLKKCFLSTTNAPTKRKRSINTTTSLFELHTTQRRLIKHRQNGLRPHPQPRIPRALHARSNQHGRIRAEIRRNARRLRFRSQRRSHRPRNQRNQCLAQCITLPSPPPLAFH